MKYSSNSKLPQKQKSSVSFRKLLNSKILLIVLLIFLSLILTFIYISRNLKGDIYYSDFLRNFSSLIPGMSQEYDSEGWPRDNNPSGVMEVDGLKVKNIKATLSWDKNILNVNFDLENTSDEPKSLADSIYLIDVKERKFMSSNIEKPINLNPGVVKNITLNFEIPIEKSQYRFVLMDSKNEKGQTMILNIE